MMVVDLSDEQPVSATTKVGVAIGLALLLSSTAYWAWNYRLSAVGEDGCFIYRPVPVLSVLALDISDPLVPANQQRAAATLRRVLDALPEGGRLVIVPLGSDVAAEPLATLNECAPARVSDLNPVTKGRAPAADARAQFETRAATALRDATARPPASTSPIIERIAVLVTFSPYLQRVEGSRTLYLLTDGLQNSAAVSFYRGIVPLPAPSESLFSSWSVSFVQTNNSRDFALQTDRLREVWQTWLTAGGPEALSIEAAGTPTLVAHAQ